MFIITFYHCVPLVSSKIAKFTRIDLNSGGVGERASEPMSNNSTSNCENHTLQNNQILQLTCRRLDSPRAGFVRAYVTNILILFAYFG